MRGHSCAPEGKGPGQKHGGDPKSAMLRGGGQQEAGPWPGLGLEQEETILCQMEGRVEERHSRQSGTLSKCSEVGQNKVYA